MMERELLAAEMALRLIEGEELLEARALLATDETFAGDVAAWEMRLAPLFDEIAPVDPPAAIRQRILAGISEAPAGEVIELRQRVRRWQVVSGLAAAAAIALALFTAGVMRSREQPAVGPAPPRPLVASLGLEGRSGSLAVTYLPQSAELLVTAAAIQPDPVHDHELWLLPAGGKPISLGVLRTPAGERIRVPAPIAAQIGAQSAIAVSAEPKGGSPTGAPTGPVVASGKLSPV